MIIPTSPLLQSFEDLGALSKEAGLYEVKPFIDWRGTPWSSKIFKMRLCNAGELLEIYRQASGYPESAKQQVIKIELLIRAIYAIDNKELVSPEELQRYNEANVTSLTKLDYLRQWAGNLEQVILDRLDMIYGNLVLKQLRMLQGVSMCVHCGTAFTELSEGSKQLKYSYCEILCAACQTVPELIPYDFIGEDAPPKPVTPAVVEEERSFDLGTNYVCDKCQKEVDSLEEFVTHREACQSSTGAPLSV